jgi:hydrogenase-4 component F
MVLLLLLLLPLAGGTAMLFASSFTLRAVLLMTVALGHNICSLLTTRQTLLAAGDPAFSAPTALEGVLCPDVLGLVFLCLASALFTAASFYAIGYLRDEDAKEPVRRHFRDGSSFTNAPQQRFLACLCFFLAAMSLVTTTQHLGALWVGIEVTTLSSAPLIYFHRHKAALEATWKYLMICSVGIALALLGNVLFSIAFYPEAPQGHNQMLYYISHAAQAEPAWLKAAFIFLLVGFGTKMGLAPLHNWLPDAHSQAPSLVSALLSGALLNCAFLGILRGHQVLNAAGLGEFSSGLLVFFGLLSMLTAALFIVGQGHYKRLLAYSSVEHMGILALGVGVGGAAVYGAMLHSVCHSLTKCMLFLLAGNVLTHYHTLSSYDVRGMRWTMPITACLWAGGFLAITGSPPFGLFVSEFSILQHIFATERYLVGAIYLTLLAVIFVGMSLPFLRMVQGVTPPATQASYKETVYNVGPCLVLGVLILTLGMYVPAWLDSFLRQAAHLVGE